MSSAPVVMTLSMMMMMVQMGVMGLCMVYPSPIWLKFWGFVMGFGGIVKLGR
ncbi:hypothetical protein Hanom_Chr01g00004701 [Helianthus anomalus]